MDPAEQDVFGIFIDHGEHRYSFFMLPGKVDAAIEKMKEFEANPELNWTAIQTAEAQVVIREMLQLNQLLEEHRDDDEPPYV